MMESLQFTYLFKCALPDKPQNTYKDETLFLCSRYMFNMFFLIGKILGLPSASWTTLEKSA